MANRKIKIEYEKDYNATMHMPAQTTMPLLIT